MKQSNYNDDFIRTKDFSEENNGSIEESDDSDIEINKNNDFFNNLFSSSRVAPKKSSNLLSKLTNNDPDSFKQSSLEDKIKKLSKKKEKKRLQKQIINANYNNTIEENEEIDPLKSFVPDEKKSKKQEKQEKFDSKQKKNSTNSKDTSSISFQSLNLIKPLLKSCDDQGFVEPTLIQKLAIPPILLGKDVMASSLTGSGKTAAFLLPILQKYYKTSFENYSKVLIIIPTRELAVQCYEMLQDLNAYTKVSSCLIIGAVPLQKQEAELRRYPDIIIATPGRLIDLLKNSQSIDLNDLEILVFDEADKLLELGFEAEISEIVKNTNPERQTLLFSATLTSDVNKLAKLALKKPIRVEANPDNTTSENLQQEVFKLKKTDESYREACLLHIASEIYNEKVIIFFKTKRKCHRMAILFGLQNINVCELHGNLSQTQRIQAYQDFKNGKYEFLLATDLAARGLDIKEVKTVINYELPIELKRYIHRVGRTARAGQQGKSLTFCNEFEMKKFKKMVKGNKEKIIKLKLEEKNINKYKKIIDNMEEDFLEIVKQENVEKELRKAEMETKKIENLLNHKEEIFNRPKKMWIQSEKDKQNILKEEKKLLGLEAEEDYKTMEEVAPKKRKKIRRK